MWPLECNLDCEQNVALEQNVNTAILAPPLLCTFVKCSYLQLTRNQFGQKSVDLSSHYTYISVYLQYQQLLEPPSVAAGSSSRAKIYLLRSKAITACFHLAPHCVGMGKMTPQVLIVYMLYIGLG
jgi:hypothetical protein